MNKRGGWFDRLAMRVVDAYLSFPYILSQAWWTVCFPGMAISLVVMATNFMGDSLRDQLDPSIRSKE
ncbi:hypothetical protein NKDENANG_02655 [Candidatus Entotheonellaceae bacterium PAL068K]